MGYACGIDWVLECGVPANRVRGIIETVRDSLDAYRAALKVPLAKVAIIHQLMSDVSLGLLLWIRGLLYLAQNPYTTASSKFQAAADPLSREDFGDVYSRCRGTSPRARGTEAVRAVPGNLAITPPRGPSNLIFLNLPFRERERVGRLSHH